MTRASNRAKQSGTPPNSTSPQATSLKAIPPARNRLQSRLLVWIVTPLILLACAQLIYSTIIDGPTWYLYSAKALALSIVFAFLAWAVRAATPAAALIGGMICLLLTCNIGFATQSPLHSAVAPLLTLFLLTLVATRTGHMQKTRRGLAESRRGRRASQVVANLGVAALVPNLIGYSVIPGITREPNISDVSFHWYLSIVVLAALAEATADTVSSEIGQAFGGMPILLTTLRRVETGVDGAISLTGTAAGILAAAMVTGAGAWSMHLDTHQACIALGAATLGLFFDSLLGATFERRGWINNDLVNFTSTAFAAAIVVLAMHLGRNHLFR